MILEAHDNVLAAGLHLDGVQRDLARVLERSERNIGRLWSEAFGVIGHAHRPEPLRDYCLGLLMLGERKSVQPIAAVIAPARISAKHQSLLHFVANAPGSDERVLDWVRELTLPMIERAGPIEARIIEPLLSVRYGLALEHQVLGVPEPHTLNLATF